MSKKISRRQFIGNLGCAALGSTTLLNAVMNLGATNVLAASTPSVTNGYKAMVCILLGGGNDSFNMLVPKGNAEYSEYQSTRSNLALPKNDLLPLNFTDSNGKVFGLHPSMPEVQALFNDNKVAFLANVGTLIEPTLKWQYQNNSARLPLGLFSHADQIMHWQTSLPESRSAVGWGGRIADVLQSINSTSNISMNISLSGSNVFQAGNSTVEYSISSKGNGSIGIENYNGPSFLDGVRTNAIDNILDYEYSNAFQKTYVDVTRHARDAHEEFSTAISAVQPFSTVFSGSELSQSLQMIAKTIASRNALSMNRQTFFVSFGGWDHHDEVIYAQAAKLGVLSKALGEFNSALEELGVQNEVTTFTISDFARTLTSNGNGTDHGWGGNAIIMGGDVNGGAIFGDYPSLALGSEQDVDNGVLLPTTSCDEYFAELAKWFGVPNADLGIVLPNIGNFYDANSSSLPIGFMQY